MDEDEYEEEEEVIFPRADELERSTNDRLMMFKRFPNTNKNLKKLEKTCLNLSKWGFPPPVIVALEGP